MYIYCFQLSISDPSHNPLISFISLKHLKMVFAQSKHFERHVLCYMRIDTGCSYYLLIYLIVYLFIYLFIYSSFSSSVLYLVYLHPFPNLHKSFYNIYVTIQNGWNNRISYGCVYAQIRSGLGMHLVTYSNHDTVLFLLIVPIKGRFV